MDYLGWGAQGIHLNSHSFGALTLELQRSLIYRVAVVHAILNVRRWHVPVNSQCILCGLYRSSTATQLKTEMVSQRQSVNVTVLQIQIVQHHRVHMSPLTLTVTM